MIAFLPSRGFGFIYAGFVIAFILEILPLHETLNYLRPLWVFLLVLYWGKTVPDRFGMASAFVVGLLFDVLMGDVFGVHALLFSLLAYFAYVFHRRMRNVSTGQQMFIVLLLAILYLFLLQVLQVFFSEPVPIDFRYWLPALSSAILWPWFQLLMNEFKAYFHIRETSN